jgi:hypothetical protein
MFNDTIDLRTSKYVGYTLPPQALPSNQKNDAWKRACMDALENIGIRMIAQNRRRFDDAYRIVEGNFQYRDILNSSLFLSEVDFWRNQAELTNGLEHYGFIEPIVNHLVGEYIKTPNPVLIHANDSFSTNDYIATKTERLWESVSTNLENILNMKMLKMGMNPFEEDFESEEQMQEYQQQVMQFKQENTPEEIEKYMNQNWRAIYIEWAEATLEEDYDRFDIDEIDRENLYDYLVTGKCFRHYRAGYDYYMPEVWSPRETFYDDSVRNVEEGDFVGQIKYLSGNQVIARWGHLLNEQEKQRILRSKDYDKNLLTYYKGTSSITNARQWAEQGGGTLRYVPHPAYFPYANAQFIQEETGIDLGMDDHFPNGRQYDEFLFYNDTERQDLVRCVEGYWVSNKRIGYLTIEDPETMEIYPEIVTDEVLTDLLKIMGIKQIRTVSLEQHEAKPEPNTIVWDYVPEVWRGIKINKNNTDLTDDLYIGIEPLTYQLKGESQTYHTKLPVTGINERTSLVARLEQEQIDYNIAMNMARDYMSKELGVFYLMDMSYLPSFIKDLGGEESITKLMDVVRELGILPVDGQGVRSGFNQFTAVNMDLTNAMLGKLQYANTVKRMAYEKIGFTPERLGTPTQKTATGIEQSVSASFSQTEVWYDKFSKFQKRSAEVHLNLAQYMKKDGVDGSVNYVDSYKTRTFINMSDPYLPLRRFKITTENNSKRRSELEIIKQVYMNDNTIVKDLESLAEVIASDSVSKVIQLGKIGRKMAELQQQMEHERRMAEIEAEQAAIDERDLRDKEWKSRENALDRQMQIYRQQILALGFEKDKDADQSGVSDVIEQSKLALDNLKYQNDARLKELDSQHKQAKDEKEQRLKERELDIEDKKVEATKYAADMKLEIARENKTKAELQAAKKLPKDTK